MDGGSNRLSDFKKALLLFRIIDHRTLDLSISFEIRIIIRRVVCKPLRLRLNSCIATIITIIIVEIRAAAAAAAFIAEA